ncbi:MAG TPA: hypothetical protein PKK06_05135 [Phycisphaerae bacterium]|nr:hypothetical protein [Phycisphaerae bacterium]
MAKASGKRTIAKCEECGGPRRGPKAHAPTCSHYKASGTASKASKGGFSMTSLRGMDVEELISVRGQLDTLIAGKAPELEEKIGKLQETLKAIKKL